MRTALVVLLLALGCGPAPEPCGRVGGCLCPGEIIPPNSFATLAQLKAEAVQCCSGEYALNPAGQPEAVCQ